MSERNHFEIEDMDDLVNAMEEFDVEAEEAGNEEKLRMAKTALQFALGLAKNVADATDDENARAYFVDPLKILAGRDHGFLSRDFNIDDWLDRLAGKGEDEDEDGDE